MILRSVHTTKPKHQLGVHACWLIGACWSQELGYDTSLQAHTGVVSFLTETWFAKPLCAFCPIPLLYKSPAGLSAFGSVRRNLAKAQSMVLVPCWCRLKNPLVDTRLCFLWEDTQRKRGAHEKKHTSTHNPHRREKTTHTHKTTETGIHVRLVWFQSIWASEWNFSR